jgi:hypothetical protein
MVISDENSRPIIIENITTPLGIDYFWTLNLEQRDFILSKLEILEEHSLVPLFAVNILGYVLEIPTNWHMLVFSEDTSQLDIIEMSEATRGNFTAFVYDHKKDIYRPGKINIIDYIQQGVVHTPALNKVQMLCHHLGPSQWVCLSPIDNYVKYLKGASIGDILP